MQIIVKARFIFHRFQKCIGLFFKPDEKIQAILRSRSLARYSRTHKCWWTSAEKGKMKTIISALRHLAVIDISELSQKENEKLSYEGAKENKNRDKIPDYKTSSNIHEVNLKVLQSTAETLVLKRYSHSTMKTYLNELTQFLSHIGNISADSLEPGHLRRYLLYCNNVLKLSENTIHSRINAIKFYYEQVLHREKFFIDIPRPKKQLQVPNFFNQHEIVRIIHAARNIKHRTMLMLCYATGMRVSEVVKLKVSDIDSKRMMILVKQSKGKKDRVVMLSPVLLVMLRAYWIEAKPDAAGYLFPGQIAGEPYSTRSLQLVLAAAKKKAGITKSGSIHALRHSFATHLLDKGTDVFMIMKLLGHNDVRTTMRYLHVTNKDLLGVISPLDDLGALNAGVLNGFDKPGFLKNS